jgi:hypothetical protein
MGSFRSLPFISFILFTLIYFSASIVFMDTIYRPIAPELRMARYVSLIVCFSVLIIIYLKKNGLTITPFPSYLSVYVFWIWTLFSISIVISELIQNAIPVQGFFFLLIVPFLYYSVMPFMTKISGQVIPLALFTANMLYLVISIATKPILILPYSGVAANPNGFGQMGALVFISGLIMLVTLSRKAMITKIGILAAMVFALVCVLLSESRTSLFIVVIITIFTTFHTLLSKRNFRPLLAIIALGLIGWFSPLRDILLSGVGRKISQLTSEGDFSNGRSEVWQGVIKEATLFGHGERYDENFTEGAHNSIIQILGYYGIIPALLLSTFLLLLLILAFINIYKVKQKIAILPFVIILTFTLYCMTESMFGLIGNGITIAFYHTIGLLIFKETSDTRVALNETEIKI